MNILNKAGAVLKTANTLQSANLRGADLDGAYLRDANLCGANLRGAYLRDADLCDANLRGANLRDASLRDASLRDADLRRADLRGADLDGADLDGVVDAFDAGAPHSYRVVVVRHDDGIRIAAGCRWMTWKEAVAYWKKEGARKPLSKTLLAHIRAMAKWKKWKL